VRSKWRVSRYSWQAPGGAAMVLWTLLRSAVITVGDAAVLFGAVCVAMAGGGAAVYAAYRLAEDRLIDRAAEYGYLDDTEDTA